MYLSRMSGLQGTPCISAQYLIEEVVMDKLIKLLIMVETLNLEELQKLSAWVDNIIDNRSKENENE